VLWEGFFGTVHFPCLLHTDVGITCDLVSNTHVIRNSCKEIKLNICTA